MGIFEELNRHLSNDVDGDNLVVGRGANHATDLGLHAEGLTATVADGSSKTLHDGGHKSVGASRAYDNRKTTMSTPVNISSTGQVIGGPTAYYGATFYSDTDALVVITSLGIGGPVLDMFACTANVPLRSSYSEGVTANGVFIAASAAVSLAGSIHVGTME